jgi:hypothetical protein
MYDQGWEFQNELVAPEPRPSTDLVEFLQVHHELRDHVTHSTFQKIYSNICATMQETNSPFLFILSNFK